MEFLHVLSLIPLEITCSQSPLFGFFSGIGPGLKISRRQQRKPVEIPTHRLPPEQNFQQISV